MLKIAIVTPFGAEERFNYFAEFLLAQGLCRLGNRVRFFTYKIRHKFHYKKNKVYQGIEVFRCRQRFGLAPGLIFSILRFRPRVVICFHPKSRLSFSAYLAARLVGAKIIYEIVGILHDPFIVNDCDNPLETIRPEVILLTSWRRLAANLFLANPKIQWQNFICHFPVAWADAIVAISEDEKKYISRFYGRDSTVIPWAMPPAVPAPQKKPTGLLPSSFLLFFAQIKKRKGWDTVLEALAVLHEQGADKNLIFVCTSLDISEAENYAKRLGVRERVFFLINISNEEKNWLFANTDAVLAPSRYEGFGLSVLEAWRAGKPFLGTAIPVYLEFLEHRKNSLVSKLGDGRDLAKNIKALDGDSALVKEIVAGGYKTLGKYTDKIMVKKFLDLIYFLDKDSAKGGSTR